MNEISTLQYFYFNIFLLSLCMHRNAHSRIIKNVKMKVKCAVCFHVTLVFENKYLEFLCSDFVELFPLKTS